MRRPRAKIEVHGHDVAKSGHGGHPLDDDRDGVHLQGACCPQKARQQGNVVGPFPVSGAEKGQIEGPEHKQEEEDGRGEVDKKVYDVIAEDVSATEEIIQSEAEIGQRPGRKSAFIVVRCSVEGFTDILPGEALEMDIAVLDDIVIIVEMPFAGKAVAVNEQQHCQQRQDGEQAVALPRRIAINALVRCASTDDHVKFLAHDSTTTSFLTTRGR